MKNLNNNTTKGNQYKYELSEIYEKVNEVVRKLQVLDKDDVRREFLYEELLAVTEELVTNNCKRFSKRYNMQDVTQDDLYAIATSFSLMEALEWFSFEKGNNFMPIWEMFMNRKFINTLKEQCTQQAKFNRNNVCSADKPLTDDGLTVYDLVGNEDFTKETEEALHIQEVLADFKKKDKHGLVIECLLIGKQDLRTKAILHVLGATTYGSAERKKVERVKKRFAEHLLKNGYDVSRFM